MHPHQVLQPQQIGISKSIFIYSFDRDPEHLEVIVNPTLVFDHLQGIECFHRKDIAVKEFFNKKDLMKFMEEVKKKIHFKSKNRINLSDISENWHAISQ